MRAEKISGRLAWGGGAVDSGDSILARVAGFCKHGVEPSGSGAKELVSLFNLHCFLPNHERTFQTRTCKPTYRLTKTSFIYSRLFVEMLSRYMARIYQTVFVTFLTAIMTYACPSITVHSPLLNVTLF
jgi:hypothetical protein